MTPPLYPAFKSNVWVALRPGHNEAELGAVRARKRIGRLGGLPSLPMALLCRFRYLGGKNRSLRQSCTAASRPRFSRSEVHGCHPPRRMGTQVLTGADTGGYGFRLNARRRQVIIGREYSNGKYVVCSQISELLEDARSAHRGHSMITA